MRADCILLECESLKAKYIDLLAEKCGEYVRSRFEDKIQVFSLKESDELNSERQGCVENSFESEGESGCNSESRKRLLFYTGFSDLFLNGDKELEKLSRVLDVFEANRDNVLVIWKQDDCYVENISNALPQYMDAVDELISRFERLKVGRIENPTFDESELDDIAAYYGDFGYYYNRALDKHIPTMIMNCDV